MSILSMIFNKSTLVSSITPTACITYDYSHTADMNFNEPGLVMDLTNLWGGGFKQFEILLETNLFALRPKIMS